MRPSNTNAIEEMFNSISSKYDFLNDILPVKELTCELNYEHDVVIYLV